MEKKEGLALLRSPFEKKDIGFLPKPYKKDSKKGKCTVCGGYHGLPAAHLEFVGHAALTNRLLEADPEWNWEPLSLTSEGLPLIDNSGGMWIKLTVCGVTRLGYGDAGGKKGGNATKELIGDALRNAAMRFGAALDLWHKGDLHGNSEVSISKEKPTESTIEKWTAWLDGYCNRSMEELEADLKKYKKSIDNLPTKDKKEFDNYKRQVVDIITELAIKKETEDMAKKESKLNLEV